VGRGLDKTVYWIVAAIINVALSFEVGAEVGGRTRRAVAQWPTVPRGVGTIHARLFFIPHPQTRTGPSSAERGAFFRGVRLQKNPPPKGKPRAGAAADEGRMAGSGQ
jgi:hypothetical protein